MAGSADDPALAATEVCVFDAYGTLFDVHSAVARDASALGPVADEVSALWRRKQLEYTWLRSLMGAYVDFWQVTADALDVALAQHGIADGDLRQRLLEAYLALDAYPEVTPTLAALQAGGRRLAILSNGSPAMLRAAVDAARLGERFAAVLSVDDVGIFKPAPVVYQLACDRLGVPAERVCFLSSNGWDVHGAAAFGFQAVWINRFRQPDERLPGAPRRVIQRLDELLPFLTGG